ncbi:MAG: flavodoxin [Aristaeellaceae bacterium]
MKKRMALILSLTLALTACAAVAGGCDTIALPRTGGTLVVYYSATGNTERIGGIIAAETGADVFALEPVNPYSYDDLNWMDPDSRVSLEHADPEAQHAVELLQITPEGWDAYDTVYIGYPIWWGIAAWPVNRFITGNDFTGKTVIPFCTSADSGLGESDTLLAEMAGAGEWLAGHRFTSREEEAEVLDWVREMQQAAAGGQ